MAIHVDNAIYTGRPSDKREENEVRCYDILDELNVEYKRADHDKADTIEDCREIERLLENEVCKNLFLCNRQRTEFYLLLLPGDKPFKTKDLSKQLGVARLSFAGEEDMKKYLDIMPGSVSVLGIANDTERRVHLVIDRDIYNSEYICCHPCRNTSTLKIKTTDVIDKIIPYTKHEVIIVNLEQSSNE